MTSKDKGEPARTGTATVRVYTENKNDEPPRFSQQVYTPNVDENAGPNTLVTTVVASDKDGDGVTFGFVGGSTTSGLFRYRYFDIFLKCLLVIALKLKIDFIKQRFHI